MSGGTRRNGRFDRDVQSEGMETNVYSAKVNPSMHKSFNGEFILYQVRLQRLLGGNIVLPPDGLIAYFDPNNSMDNIEPRKPFIGTQEKHVSFGF